MTIFLLDGFDDYFSDEEPFIDSGWVIPHHSSLDYCHVNVVGEAKDGRLIVRGRRNRGWIEDNAEITCKIQRDKLTEVNSDHVQFLELYDDPCHPVVQDI